MEIREACIVQNARTFFPKSVSSVGAAPDALHRSALRQLPPWKIPPCGVCCASQLLFENKAIAEPRITDIELEYQVSVFADARAKR